MQVHIRYRRGRPTVSDREYENILRLPDVKQGVWNLQEDLISGRPPQCTLGSLLAAYSYWNKDSFPEGADYEGFATRGYSVQNRLKRATAVHGPEQVLRLTRRNSQGDYHLEGRVSVHGHAHAAHQPVYAYIPIPEISVLPALPLYCASAQQSLHCAVDPARSSELQKLLQEVLSHSHQDLSQASTHSREPTPPVPFPHPRHVELLVVARPHNDD